MSKKTLEVVIRDDLFKEIGLKVDKCSAFIDDADKYVRINGSITCVDLWDEKYYLKVKANLYDGEDDILHIDYDYDKKTFIKISYESFSINCYKGNADNIKYVEVYPKLINISDAED